MRQLVLLIFILNLFPSYLQAGSQIPVFEVKKPTVIAFFHPVTDDELNSNAGLNEVLSDFQYHLRGARVRLEEAGITVHEIYTRSFTVKLPTSTTIFKPTGDAVGYYLIVPGKNPKIVYGVMTDSDLLFIANKYFGKKII